MKKISHSEITTYLDCQKKWDLVYNQGISIDNPHLVFGSMAHKVMETGNIPDEILYPELKEFFKINSWKNYFGKILNDITEYMTNAGYKMIEKEHFVEDEILRGCIDSVWFNESTGNYLITDYKFSNGHKGYEELQVDEQMYIYAYMYSVEKGIPLEKIETGYINIPKYELVEPAVLRNGKLSKAVNQRTTYDLYLKAIYQNNLDKSDYEDILEMLSSQKYIEITIAKLNIDRLKDVFGNIDKVITDMSKGYILEKHTYQCTKCDYYKVCKLKK